MANEAQTKQNRPPRYRNFGMILYPEDPRHEWTLQHINRYPRLYKAVYILHDKDVWGQDDLVDYREKHDGQDPNWNVGEPKKAHYHVLVEWTNATTPEAVSKRLGLSHVEAISDKFSYVMYMLHDGADWMDKYQYPIECLKGDQPTISKLLTQNVHFVQLAQYADMARKGMSLPDMVDHVLGSSDSKILIETFDKYNHFIVAMRNDLKTTPRPASVLSPLSGVEQAVSYSRNYPDSTGFVEV